MYFDPWMAGVVLPSMIIVGLMAIPYIDTNKPGNGYYSYQIANSHISRSSMDLWSSGWF